MLQQHLAIEYEIHMPGYSFAHQINVSPSAHANLHWRLLFFVDNKKRR